MVMDVFKSDAFSMMSLLQAIETITYNPQFITSLNLFQFESSRTRTVGVEMRDDELALIPTSPIGAPPPQFVDNRRTLRDLRTVRLAKGSTIYAEEVQGIRAFGSETELLQAQAEVARHLARLKQDWSLTCEHMQLGAIQGLFLESDGSVMVNFFDEFGVSQPAAVTFDFSSLANGAVRTKIESEIVRPMIRASRGAITTGSRIMALVGDEFWDALIANAEVRQSYLNYTAAASLREATLYTTFPYGGVDWINYRGTDDNSTVAIATDEAKLFPVNAPGVFKVVWGPGEFMDTVNQPGVPLRPLVLMDPSGRNAFATVEVYSYPLYLCTRPLALRRAVLA